MATFTTLINALFLPGKKILGATGMALRDNLLSAFEGDATAAAAGVTLKDAALDTGPATVAGTTWVGLRTAELAVGAVGSYAFLGFNIPQNASEGTTHAGSGLRYASATGAIATAPSGTWRVMGRSASGSSAGSTSLFLRIS